MVEEEGSIGAGSSDGLALEEEGAPVFEMNRQDVIDAFSGNRRRVVQQGGQLSIVIERIDPADSGEGADLFTPPEVPQEPQV